MLVLVFHARVPWFSGGYIGVDVFFVISGYLIATLILHEHAAGRFTLAGFYQRRIRRIFPALFLVVLSTVAMAALVMLPPDLVRLGSSVVASALFGANFYFWAQGLDYLQGKPDFEPLLHTWSLAIEEQFYLLFPIFMLVILRSFKRLDLAFLGLALASFAISVYLSTTHPRAAFYFSASRAWELLLGAWLAVTCVKDLVPRRIVPALQVAGLVMIAGAAVTYDTFTPFPGFAALVPCVGTALLIAWCNRVSRLNSALGHPSDLTRAVVVEIGPGMLPKVLIEMAVGVRFMPRRLVALVSAFALAFGSAGVQAATVSKQVGTVLVNTGNAFVPLSGSADFAPGSQVMVRPGGVATISYDNCTVRVGSGFWLVQEASPCAAGVTEIDFTTTKMSGGALDPPPPAPRYDFLVIGGGLIATCLLIWCQPASP